MLTCVKCGEVLKSAWNYCPYCGHKIVKNPLTRLMDDLTRLMKKSFSGFFDSGERGVKIKIRSPRRVVVKREDDRRVLRKVPDVKEEAVMNVKRIRDKIIYELELPGVKSLRDVKLMRFPESLEVRAYAPEKLYFKIIPLNKQDRLLSRELINEKLILTIRTNT